MTKTNNKIFGINKFDLNRYSNKKFTSLSVSNNSFYLIIKRLFDILLSAFLLIFLFSWFSLFLAIIIKIDSVGPVFFMQKRTGKNKESFYCIKFRTMYLNKNANRLAVTKDDERITAVGKFLRRYFIDEFPQLINVLKGEMSLVGPRPFMLRENIDFSKKIANYHNRHLVKPGITGLAQVMGFHGTIHNDKDLHSRINADLYYVANRSFKLDLYILFGTFLNFFK